METRDTPLSRLNIMVVDDEPSILHFLSRFLAKRCQEVETFERAQEALERFKEKQPDLIISDIRMPVMNGIEFCREIKKLNPKATVVFLSATDDREHLTEAINVGCDRFLSKPVQPEQMIQTLNTVADQILMDKEAGRQQRFLEDQLQIKNRTLYEQTAILERIRQAISQGFLLRQISRDGKLIFANANFKERFGVALPEGIGAFDNRFFSLQEPENADINFLLKTTENAQRTLRYKTPKGMAILKSTLVPLPDTAGGGGELIEISCDVTEIHELSQKLVDMQEQIIFALGNIVETRSQETFGHVQRVALYSEVLAHAYGLDAKESTLLKTASPLHDVGKVGIPDQVLKKPGKLTSEEFTMVRQHTLIGYELLKNAEGEIFSAAAVIAREHHERWDGQGYPRGLAGESTSLFARITAVADVFDAVSSKRCYKAAWDFDESVAYILSESAKAFDPHLVACFRSQLSKIREIKELSIGHTSGHS